ncbi:unnamed protein product [Agarophyton chilense]|eukprot:gb/GEZJ01002911.1/.p1 GENE.gb/GEZJ01002911.1/~~gb/GEZJ01002911.1/.p1  ORF type:complete len:179 (-),score=18.71 gb/GEZJ01002911.1/:60-596(-)
MPRLLNFRALCALCERAEAHVWSVSQHRPLCAACATRHNSPSPCDDAQQRVQHDTSVPIAARTVVSALCSACARAPAVLLSVRTGASLCAACAERAEQTLQGEVLPLRDVGAADDMVFDRMDFSAGHSAELVSDGCCAEARVDVDMSYYQTKVPPALVRHRKRAGDAHNAASPSQRRR